LEIAIASRFAAVYGAEIAELTGWGFASLIGVAPNFTSRSTEPFQ
jgi:hypothetical protein